MQIHQMSVSYLPEQDRMLLRIRASSGEETRMWLTRRLMAGLWPVLSRVLTDHLLKLEAAGSSLAGADPQLRQMLADFRKEEFLQHADFDTPYQEAATLAAAGEEPLLVTDVEVTPLAQGPLRLRFRERPATAGDRPARSAQLEMEPKVMQGLMHLLEQALVQSQWREPFVPAAPDTSGTEEAGRPRYLN